MKNCKKYTSITIGLILIVVLNFSIFAQVTERERPKDWDTLVEGGRFMDLFLPIPVNGILTSKTWGGKNVIPRYIDNGLENNEYSFWGGNAKVGNDGKYHLFVCGWREDAAKGHMEWPNSSVYHAVANNPLGPYSVKDSVGLGHNPEIFQLKDGRYVIYVINSYFISKELNGPWESGKFEFDNRERKIIEGLSNLTFAQREDGSYLMICRGGGVWFSETGISPYYQVTDKRVYPRVEGRFEDPLVWRDNIQYHLIVNDWLGRIAWYLRSKDGINWKVDPGEAYKPGIAVYEDGTTEDWFKYERIKVLQDKYGRATQAHFAVIDTLKKEDKGSDRHSSKHICIPLTVGRLLTILDSEKISGKTKLIHVKVEAEENFNPQTDIDFESLRFGASEEVNFGRGCKFIKTEKLGNDLVITFDGKGNGITDDNFAAKLLGKTNSGKLLFGYARLPEVDYLKPALSARLPKFGKSGNGFDIDIEIQNFGLVESKPSGLKILCEIGGKEVEIASSKISKLNSFQKTTLKLNCRSLFAKGEKYPCKIIIESESQRDVTLDGEILPFQ